MNNAQQITRTESKYADTRPEIHRLGAGMGSERQARIDAERTRLQKQIDALNNRALSPTFTQGMRQARIEKIREEMDALEAEE